ncbi:hypothetical protein DL96DRAFT_1463030 [Flagelloscypha sp. PMI_526]|nr:hypothetical protein DL96DRAFT_1462996 [Flagelloscypha sp. PMI_526]KAH8828730.1 hypothetical protein DL96DRAFT_1463030 [Flagelloscypha sp. PMI_526]
MSAPLPLQNPGTSSSTLLGPTRKVRPRLDTSNPYTGKKRGPKPKQPKTSAITQEQNHRSHLTTFDWLQVYAYVDNNPGLNQSDIVKHFASLPLGKRLIFTQSTLSRKLEPDARKQVECRAASNPNGLSAKRDRVVTRPDVERGLFLWIQKMNSQSEIVSDAMLVEKQSRLEILLEIPEGECLGSSNGWVRSFKKTYDSVLRR